MKTAVRTFACLALLTGSAAAPLRAAAPARAFRRALAAFKADPDGPGLREKVILRALDLPTTPAVPDEVTVLKGEAMAAMKSASQASDYLPAVKAYAKATNLAPWVGALYYNKGVLEQLAALPGPAVADFRLYLLAAPDASDKDMVLERIGKLESQLRRAEAQKALDAANAAAQAAWQSKKNVSTAWKVSGIVGSVVGAAVGAWGLGTASGATRFSTPTYSGGVEYNIPHNGSYWSSASYNQCQQGLMEQYIGWPLLVVGLVAGFTGVALDPGPFAPKTALLNIKDGRLALGVPLPSVTGPAGTRTTLLYAEF